uniref:Uncharacterized protein n=1 Tax=Spongospora subterranea TaxID=70186 RepID=A0A0H5RP37_9EUKA|eukprot:CRZ10484.1 hypothetical protein [Spongospora subterranea]
MANINHLPTKSGLYKVILFVASVTCLCVYSLNRTFHLEDAVDITTLTTSDIVSPRTLLLSRTASFCVILGTVAFLLLDSAGVSVNVHKLDTTMTVIKMTRFQRLATFTTWSWCLQGAYFAGILSLQTGLITHPSAVTCTLVAFEAALSLALLVTTVVTFVLIPSSIRVGADPSSFFTLPALLMHNANVVMIVFELLVNKTVVNIAHLPFAILYGIIYVVFSWILAQKTGVFFYFFLNYNYSRPVTALLLLVGTLSVFFAMSVGISKIVADPLHHPIVFPLVAVGTLFICTVRSPKLKSR